MELDHEFTVPVPVDEAWSLLLDVERVASCMPGATLDSVDGEEYAGRLKVKVGAMTITYRGTARVTSADESARTVTVEAAAKEARGPGTASSTVVSRLHDEGDTTRVTVHTKLNVTGRPAQVGRDVLSEAGARLIARFAKALADQLEAPPAPPQAAPPESEPPEAAPPGAEAPESEPQGAQAPEDEAPEGEPTSSEVTEASTPPTVVEQSAASASAGPTEESAAAPVMPKVPRQRPASPVETTASGPVTAPINRQDDNRPDTDDAGSDGGAEDDRGATAALAVAGPSVAKRAVPALGAVAVTLLTIRYLLRRRNRRDA